MVVVVGYLVTSSGSVGYNPQPDSYSLGRGMELDNDMPNEIVRDCNNCLLSMAFWLLCSWSVGQLHFLVFPLNSKRDLNKI